jgi:diguanylate cyclase (GGDEF)-like protein
VLEKRLSHQAYHDPLTDLPNRPLFLDRLECALVARRKVAVLFIDIDNFKVINDSLGHDAGDQLLIQIARRLQNCARRADTVSRLGGDEFTILADEIESENDALQMAHRICETISRPTMIDQRQVLVTASIGIATNLEKSEGVETMLREADTAMYHAKSNGKSRWSMFAESMNNKAVERLNIETGIRRGLENNEFELYYQPIIDMRTGKTTEVEALVRWQHPEHGLFPPIKFIPIAEETGQITELGRWILREACRQAAEWRRELRRDIVVNVNVSPKQLRDNLFQIDVEQALLAFGLPASCLKLEITESAMMGDESCCVDELRSLRDKGVGIAVDDFGTGYSSMAYLNTLPIDTIKIDRVFIGRIDVRADDSAIVNAIIGLSKNLGLRIISEGVETLNQHRILVKLGCDYGQGYYYAPPLTANSMREILAANAVLAPMLATERQLAA